MASKSNEQTLRGSLKAIQRINDHVMSRLLDKAARNLLLIAVDEAEGWLGFTGNLPRSYAAGIYDSNRRLSRIIWAGDVYEEWNRPRVSPKIKYGRTMYLENPYEGNARLNVASNQEGKIIKNPTPVVYDDGRAFSAWFLNQYQVQHPYSIVICTGAEYSEWLERDRGVGGVLTNAARKAGVKMAVNMAVKGMEYELERVASGNMGDMPFEAMTGATPF